MGYNQQRCDPGHS